MISDNSHTELTKNCIVYIIILYKLKQERVGIVSNYKYCQKSR